MTTRSSALLLVLSFVVSVLAAPPRGTPAEAKAMLAKAVVHYKAAGRAKALADFTAGKPPFRDRDLYVVCIESHGLISANGAFPNYVGMPADVLKDADGKPLGRAILALASASNQGSVHYPMINPVSGKVEPKTMFGEKVGTDVCGVGVYSAR